MKFKTFVLILALSCFSASLFAQPVGYSFSGFGGGLPGSATKISTASLAAKSNNETTSQRIIIGEENEPEEENDYDYYDEPKVNKSKNAALITTYIVLGVVVVAGVFFGTVYMTNQSAQCCETGANGFFEGCAEGCGESCSEGCDEAISEACAASMEGACDEACSSSTSSSSAECSETTLNTLLTGGFNLIPVFIP